MSNVQFLIAIGLSSHIKQTIMIIRSINKLINLTKSLTL